MNRTRIHQPPAPPVIAALVRAGLSLATANAMEPWKAAEVLDLLHAGACAEPQLEPVAPARGTI